MKLVASGALLLATSALATAALAAPTSVPSPAPASIADLVKQVSLPFEQFTLPNGLRVVVHTDRKAPVVAVSVWYHVGSKDEPAGETGFAHLYEHLMFYGSENAPGEFFQPLQEVGATDMNGSTAYDRTNYFETVPTTALPLALFLESDRMGHLLGAIDQERLDAQRGVVQNEKRQNDTQPYGLVDYAQNAALAPPTHPYGHTIIGSMADLDHASLETVKGWFRSHYGPNNAVLVLAGDIDLATARTLVTKYFGDIPRGPEVTPTAAAVPTLPARKDEVIHDRVATTRLYRTWYVAGLTAPDLPALDVGASVLGGLSSSRLDNILVRGEKLAVSVSASVQPLERLSQFEVAVNVRPGVDPALVAKRLDAILADYIRTGPTADEVQRAVTGEVSGQLASLESVGGFGGQAPTLAEGALYANDPGFYQKQLAVYAALTPDAVRTAIAKWLGRPVYALTVAPGPRGAYEEARAGKGDVAPVTPPPPPAKAADAAPAPGAGTVARPQDPKKPARTAPAVGTFPDLRFPAIQHARLANGIAVDYAQRTAVPITRVSLAFDAGNAADPKDKLGLQSLMLALLDEGTATRSSIQIAEAKERLGASIGAAPTMDQTVLSLGALTPNLQPSLDLFADVVRNPAFAPAEVERLRATQLAGIAAEMTRPEGIALRTLPPLLYGRANPYGVPFSGTGDPAAVARVTRADLVAFQHAWLRPDNARLFVVSDKPLAEVLPMLDRSFGQWQPTGARGTKNMGAALAGAGGGRVLLIDQPDSPQSLILGGQVTPATGPGDDWPALQAANDVIGGDVTSRLSLDLRETRHWSYGVDSSISHIVGRAPFFVFAPVQTNRTGDSLAALRGDLGEFLTSKGTTPAELARTINNRVRALPGSFETGGAVLTALRTNALFGRPDTYYDTIAARYRALDAAALDRAVRATLRADAMLWVVVGDAKEVAPQLAKVGLPVERIKAGEAK